MTNGGMAVNGLYSEIDGQLFAWLGKFLIKWGKPFDMNTLNPFQGMGSVFVPVNSWWNPGAIALGLPNSNLINYILSYSAYWLEIFFATYLLAKTIGLNKIESILTAELFVLLIFPPFSNYFNTSPLFSLVPVFAHLLALLCIMIIAYVKLGEGGVVRNLFLAFFLSFTSFIVILSTGFGLITCIPIYALLAFGFTLQNFDRKHGLWKIGTISLIACSFLIMHGINYYQDTVGYVSSSIGMPKSITFSIPKIFQKHTSIFYGSSNIFSYLHIFALLGGIVGLFYREGKYRTIAISFIIIILLPDVMGFLFENSIISGSINQIGVDYYIWTAYPLYCIFSVILISFFCGLSAKIMNYIITNFPFNMPKRLSSRYFVFHSFFFNYKFLIPFCILPVLTFYIWFVAFSKYPSHIKEPVKTPIVSYLQDKIGLKPGKPFRGTTVAYLASKNSPLRQINFEIVDKSAPFSASHYIMAREYLNIHFHNRHMFTDLWGFNIPTLEEYAHWISIPMYIYFKNMLAEETDVLNTHFLNVYKLDLKSLRAMGVRFIITDKILHEDDLSLVMTEKQENALKNGYVEFKVTFSAKKILEELGNKYKNDIIPSTTFKQEFKENLSKLYPDMLPDTKMAEQYFDSAINSALGIKRNKDQINWSYADIKKIKLYFDLVMFTWMASPPIYLYEIKNPNLATYSPTHIIQVNSSKELFLRMKKTDFSFEKSMIVQDELPKNIVARLVTAKNAEMRFERNSVRIKADSAGWSMLLLPLQYSHCYRLIDMSPTSTGLSTRFVRANLVNGALLFNGKLDVKMNFDFGIGRNTNCRRKDLQDIQFILPLGKKGL